MNCTNIVNKPVKFSIKEPFGLKNDHIRANLQLRLKHATSEKERPHFSCDKVKNSYESNFDQILGSNYTLKGKQLPLTDDLQNTMQGQVKQDRNKMIKQNDESVGPGRKVSKDIRRESKQYNMSEKKKLDQMIKKAEMKLIELQNCYKERKNEKIDILKSKMRKSKSFSLLPLESCLYQK